MSNPAVHLVDFIRGYAFLHSVPDSVTVSCHDAAVPAYLKIIGYKSGNRHVVYPHPVLAYSVLLWKSLVRLTQHYGNRLLARISYCSGSL